MQITAIGACDRGVLTDIDMAAFVTYAKSNFLGVTTFLLVMHKSKYYQFC